MSNAQVQKMMGGWANYLDVVQRNLKTARVGWVPNPERVRLGDIWARALQEVYFKRLSTEEAMKRANAEMESVFKEVGLKK
jgi:ABC-type glycerol-3-phosphate transport system substrate-binding protein